VSTVVRSEADAGTRSTSLAQVFGVDFDYVLRGRERIGERNIWDAEGRGTCAEKEPGTRDRHAKKNRRRDRRRRRKTRDSTAPYPASERQVVSRPARHCESASPGEAERCLMRLD
jgi:hypothetical protein